MKLLLDENLPKRLKNDFPEHNVYTVADMGWNSMKNGALMRAMTEENFEALLTFDKNLQYQQNFNKYPIPVIVLDATDNTYHTLKTLVPAIKAVLQSGLQAGATVIQ